MRSVEAYIKDTEIAVQHFFFALQDYAALTVPPSLADHADEIKDGGLIFNNDTAKVYFQELVGSHRLDFAKATLCGSILQVAYKAIDQYSENEDIDSECSALHVSPATTAVKFCVGRHINGIPLGLLVYAARIQYNHWDEGTPTNRVAKAVFHKLKFHYLSDCMFDMAYEIDWPEPHPVSHHVLLHELCWMTYEDYFQDMQEVLEPAFSRKE